MLEINQQKEKNTNKSIRLSPSHVQSGANHDRKIETLFRPIFPTENPLIPRHGN